METPPKTVVIKVKRKYTRRLPPKDENGNIIIKVKRKYTRKTKTSPEKITVKSPLKSPAKTVDMPSPPIVPKKRKYTRKNLKKSPVIPISEIPSQVLQMQVQTQTSPPKTSSQPSLKVQYIQLMDDLAFIMRKRKDMMRALAYTKARDTMENVPENILTSPEPLKGKPGIGPTIYQKLVEFTETGTLNLLQENEGLLKTKKAMEVFMNIYGVGEKKAEDLVEKGVTTLDELKARQYELLNDKQQIGLKYYHDILLRIPREEIVEYERVFRSASASDTQLEIVGSYRRGLASSGDIDVILTARDPTHFQSFIDTLRTKKVIEEVLSCGNSKCLVVARLSPERPARRVDFLYTSPQEYPFSVLYFTGSKGFNTAMREHALSMQYTLNEHGLSKMEGKKKGALVDHTFADEAAIFAFLNMEYKTPQERVDGHAVVLTGKNPPEVVAPTAKASTAKKLTQKNRQETVAPVPITTPPPNPPITTPPLTPEAPSVSPASSVPKEPLVPKDPLVPKEPLPVAIPAPAAKKRVTKKKAPAPAPENTVIATERAPAKTSPQTMNHIQAFKQVGISALATMTEDTLAGMIHASNHAFHTMGNPILTDGEYDVLREYMEERHPGNAILRVVGAEIVVKNKATLPYEMASMDKIKPDSGTLAKWMSKYQGPYVISCKLDGVSGLYTTEGETPKLYTRGDGKTGQDITYLIPYLKLPQDKGVAIRGEFIIKKKTFQDKYRETYANSRNLVAGIVNAKTLDARIRDLDFVAYEVIRPDNLSPSQQMAWLKSHTVIPVKNETLTTITNEVLSNKLQELRANYEYEIDGIIVSDDHVYPRASGNPEHSFAFKMVLTDQVAETHVVGVEWNASKDGYLKPTVLVQPVVVGGVTIRKATGFNADFIEKHRIGIGAVVQIIRSGDVIPYIKTVTTPAAAPLMPSEPYIWNKTHIDILLENVGENKEVRVKQIAAFFKALEVPGLAEATVAKFVGAGYDTVPKIMNMTLPDYTKDKVFTSATAQKLMTSIHEKAEKATLPTLMSASGQFGRGFGLKKMEVILEAYPAVLSDRNVAQLAAIHGMSKTTAAEFIEKIPAFVGFMTECSLSHKLEGPPPRDEQGPVSDTKDTSHPLYGKTVVMTGFRDKSLEEQLKALGSKIGASVNKQTFALLVKNREETSGKRQQAETLNIPIYTLEEFKAQYNI